MNSTTAIDDSQTTTVIVAIKDLINEWERRTAAYERVSYNPGDMLSALIQHYNFDFHEVTVDDLEYLPCRRELEQRSEPERMYQDQVDIDFLNDALKRLEQRLIPISTLNVIYSLRLLETNTLVVEFGAS